ncbi:cell surface protein SprA [candidate division WOR-3 bacterium]|nr:cell surface protein SprA [candidate division WOR-3 bacterium]
MNICSFLLTLLFLGSREGLPLQFLGRQGSLPLQSTLTSNLDISWDKKFITYYKTKNGVIVDFEVCFFSDFLSYLTESIIKDSWKKEFKEISSSQRGPQGLLPIIQLPIKFPAPVAGIIGQGGKLDVSGVQSIKFGGSKTQNLLKKETETTHESWFPTLDMKQHLGVNLKGTIGEKINVFIDHDSEREFDLENTIKLEYNGDEDEIIQSIKAGNTELSLPRIELIGGGVSHQGLFGIKTQAKIGPINITAIASKEQTENQTRDWVGKSVVREVEIKDTDFTKSRFFVLLPPEYIKSLTDRHNLGSGNPALLPKQIIGNIRVFVDEKGYAVGERTEGQGIDIPIDLTQPVDTVNGLFLEKGRSDEFYREIDTTLLKLYYPPVLELNYPLSKEAVLAIQWKYVNWNDSTITVGIIDTLKEVSFQGLQIIKRERHWSSEDTSYVSWWYELKNIYSIGATNIEQANFDVKVFKYNRGGGEDIDVDINTGKTYQELLGLKSSIGRLNLGVLDAGRGLIIFPLSYPFLFDTLFTDSLPQLYPEPDSIYNNPKLLSSEIQPKYYIWVQYKGMATEYSLDMINIVPNSEVVTINGRSMKKGEDYEIDYERGWIKFLTREAEDPNANIKVNFQYVPFFQPVGKNLIGIKGDSKIGETGYLSSALIYHSTSTLDFRPKLGTEPKRIILGELVGNISTKPEFLTRWIDKLPLIETEAPSSFSIGGNVGFSLPNPNTKGEVWLDDMEGVKTTTSLGISRANWSYGSMPAVMSDSDEDILSFAQVLWYNPRNGIKAEDLYPELPEHKRNEKRNVLTLELPDLPDQDWRYPAQCSSYWTSLLTCISRRGMDLSESEYLEIWAKGETGILHIDIGTNIEEDAPRRNAGGEICGFRDSDKPTTEDKINKNNKLDEGEDTGLDGIAGEDGKNVTGDDGNDDYHYDTNKPDDYLRINGTENDGRLNTEDLDLDGFLNKQNDYFSFKIDLANTSPTISRANGWKLFRIPLDEFNKKEGTPQWECIKYARIWVDEISKDNEINIAALDIAGSRWKHMGSDGVKISAKNTDENPDYASPPIELEKDAYGRTEREQSLALEYNLPPNDEGGCYTPYTKAKDFIQYKKLKIWVKGVNMIGKANLSVRLVCDAKNYYEHRTQIPTGWDEIEIDLDEITRLKSERTGADTIIFSKENYRILGNPSLTKIMRIELGVSNEDSIQSISGEVWLDELKLSDVRREGGIMGMVSLSCGLADLATIDLSYAANNPYFKDLGTFMNPYQSLATNSNRILRLGIRGFSLNKLLPQNWGISLPLALSYTTSSSFPKYETDSDVKLTEEESKAQKNYNLQRSGSISFSKSPSKNPLLRLTLDNISASFRYNDGHSRSPIKIDSSLSHSASLGYRYSPPLPSIKIKGFEIKYYPENISVTGSYSYSWSTRYEKVDTIWTHPTSTPSARSVGAQGSFSYNPIRPLSFNYSMRMSGDLNIDRPDKETSRSENMNATFSPSFFNFISPSVSYSVGYQEDHAANLDSLRNVGVGSNTSFRTPIVIDKIIKLITGLRDEKLDSETPVGSPHWVLMQIEHIVNKISFPSFSYSIRRSNQVASLLERPCFKYRFGIVDEPEVKMVIDPDNPYISSTGITRTYSLSSMGISIGNISLSDSYNKTISIGGDNRVKSVSTRHPNLSLRIPGLEKWFFLSKLFNSLSLSSSYSTGQSESGPELGEPENISKDRNLRGDLQVQWKKGISTGFSGSLTLGENKTLNALTESKRIDYSLSSSYSFRAPTGIKLPFFKHIRWTSDLNTSLVATYSINQSTTKNIKNSDSNSLSVTSQLSYNFSTNITGGANVSYSHQWNKVPKANTRTIGMGFSVEFRF